MYTYMYMYNHTLIDIRVCDYVQVRTQACYCMYSLKKSILRRSLRASVRMASLSLSAWSCTWSHVVRGKSEVLSHWSVTVESTEWASCVSMVVVWCLCRP